MTMHAVVIAVDALHLGYLGCYGGEWIDTPALNQFAHDAFVFDQCFANRPARFAALDCAFGELADLYPELSVERGRDNPLLAAIGDGRIQTALFTNDPDFAAPIAAKGFATIERIEGLWRESLAELFSHAVHWTQGQSRGESASLGWIDLSLLAADELLRESGLCHESADSSAGSNTLHDDESGQPTDEQIAAVRHAFAQAVAAFDAALGAFLSLLKHRPTHDEWLIVLTADQGLSLGEHGFVGRNAASLFEERTHIPLLLQAPGGRRAARSLALAQSADLSQTLADFFGLPTESSINASVAAEDTAGSPAPQSLAPIARGEQNLVHDYLCLGCNDALYAIRTQIWNFLLAVRPDIQTGTPTFPRRLFAKPEDRWDINDIAEQHAAVADALELQLRRYLDAVHRGTLDKILPMKNKL